MKYFKIINSIKRKEVGRVPQCEDALWNGDPMGKYHFGRQGQEGPIIGDPALPSPILHKSAKPSDFLGVVPMYEKRYMIISHRFFNYFQSKLDTDFQHWQIKVFNNQMRYYVRKGKYLVKDKSKLKEYKYHILHISYPYKDLIDYEKSSFYYFKKTQERIDYDKATFLTDARIKFHDKDFKRSGQKYSVQNIEIIEDNIKFLDHDDLWEHIHYNKNKSPHKNKNNYLIKPKKIVFKTREINHNIFRINAPSIHGVTGYYVSEKIKNEMEELGFTGMTFIPLSEIANDVYDVEVTE